MNEPKLARQTGPITGDGVPFHLFAPRVKSVAIAGSWNGFQSLPMAKAANGVWWIAFPLDDGEYEYAFEVMRQDGQPPVRIADPTGMRFAADNCSIVAIYNGQPIYVRHHWQHDEADLVANEQLILYELHIGDFHEGDGTFESTLEKLDYLVELGITGIEFLPVTQGKNGDNWGYSQHSLYGIDRTYGTPDALARLVDECHKRGLRVIHDGVYNHLHEDAPLVQLDPTYWFYEVNPDKPELHFGPKFNYEYHDETLGIYPAREHALGAIHRWIGTFHMDGVRFDSTRALKHFELIGWLDEQAHQRAGFKPFLTIAEHLKQDPTITGPDGPVDSAWHDHFYRQLNCTVLGIPIDDHQPFDTTELLRVLDAKTDGYVSNYNTIHYLNNHDQERAMYRLRHEIRLDAEAATRRCKLGASLLLTAPGIPMLWMGEEFGQASERGEHTEQKPLDWSLLDDPQHRALWEHYRRLIWFRRDCAALCSDHFAVVADAPEHGVIAFRRWDDSGEMVLVIANLKDQRLEDVTLRLDGIPQARWRDLLTGDENMSQPLQWRDSLDRSGVKIYSRVS
jgi:1,4-alpha-glucan branching enzyme